MTEYDSKGAFEKLHEDPFLPPVPPPKKRMSGWAIAGLIILGLVILGQFTKSDEATSTYTPSTTSVDSGTSYGVSADDVVDAMGSAQQANFCNLYTQLGDYDAALSSFTSGYGSSQDPSAVEVFDELLSRC